MIMSILSVFVIIPALMLLGLWLAKNLNQVRGVMVAGASCLLALSIWLTIYNLRFIWQAVLTLMPLNLSGTTRHTDARRQTARGGYSRQPRWHPMPGS